MKVNQTNMLHQDIQNVLKRKISDDEDIILKKFNSNKFTKKLEVSAGRDDIDKPFPIDREYILEKKKKIPFFKKQIYRVRFVKHPDCQEDEVKIFMNEFFSKFNSYEVIINIESLKKNYNIDFESWEMKRDVVFARLNHLFENEKKYSDYDFDYLYEKIIGDIPHNIEIYDVTGQEIINRRIKEYCQLKGIDEKDYDGVFSKYGFTIPINNLTREEGEKQIRELIAEYHEELPDMYDDRYDKHISNQIRERLNKDVEDIKNDTLT